MDLDVRLQISSVSRTSLLDQVVRDTQLLEKLHIMDYSLLLGIHFPAWGDDHWAPPHAPPVSLMLFSRSGPLTRCVYFVGVFRG
jgi:hypothetical protein